MKKKAFPAALVLIATGLSGCPIYDQDSSGCFDDLDCSSGYLCDVDNGSCYAEPESTACRRPSDCGTNETCSRSATCTVGDCHFASVGCLSGYVCDSVDGRWECLKEGTSEGGAPGTGGAPSANAGEPAVAGSDAAGTGTAGQSD